VLSTIRASQLATTDQGFIASPDEVHGQSRPSCEQGKRTLIPCQANNLREVVAIPPCHATPHGDTLFVVLLLEEADGEAFQPGKVVCGVAITESTIILLSPVVKVTGTGI
jgi:hypothetical protein